MCPASVSLSVHADVHVNTSNLMLAPFRPSAHDERILTELCDSLLQSSIELFNNRKQCRSQCHRHKRTRATNWTQNKEWQLSGLHVSWCVERLLTSSGAAGNAATRQHTTRRGHETLPRGRGQFGIRRSALAFGGSSQLTGSACVAADGHWPPRHHTPTNQYTNTAPLLVRPSLSVCLVVDDEAAGWTCVRVYSLSCVFNGDWGRGRGPAERHGGCKPVSAGTKVIK